MTKFFLAKTFQESLNSLNLNEQKSVKIACFELQTNPSNPGLSCHKIENIKDVNFWSARVNKDIRIIFHKLDDSLMLCYVNHHDQAYDWAGRRKIQNHPITGAAQIVEIREKIKEIEIPIFKEKSTATSNTPPLFGFQEKELLSYGIPNEWIFDIKNADENNLLEIATHLPAEAAEAVLDLASGIKPKILKLPINNEVSPYDHPDAKRRFRLLEDLNDLKIALKYPWEKWIYFLHPAQKDWVKKNFNGPTKIQGAAGTGKTVVALHRAIFLLRKYKNSRVLITTFSQPLASLLKEKVYRMIFEEPLLSERLDILDLQNLGKTIYKAQFKELNLIEEEKIKIILKQNTPEPIRNIYGDEFIFNEFHEIIDSLNITDWETYKSTLRIGKKSRLNETKRNQMWNIFKPVLIYLSQENLVTEYQMFNKAADKLINMKYKPYQHVIVDECQDINASQLRLISGLAGLDSNSLFFAGDLGQRIFQKPFSWLKYGVDIRGRSKTLRINYRTSHQIRKRADTLLDPETIDADGNIQDRREALSVFNGPEPKIKNLDNRKKEIDFVSDWIQKCVSQGLAPREIGVFVRDYSELIHAENALKKTTLPFEILKSTDLKLTSKVTLTTMHLAKGLEFKAVVIMACEEDIIPSAKRMKAVTDETELEEILNSERNLLYVACTRAREILLITSGKKSSEFIDDLMLN